MECTNWARWYHGRVIYLSWKKDSQSSQTFRRKEPSSFQCNSYIKVDSHDQLKVYSYAEVSLNIKNKTVVHSHERKGKCILYCVSRAWYDMISLVQLLLGSTSCLLFFQFLGREIRLDFSSPASSFRVEIERIRLSPQLASNGNQSSPSCDTDIVIGCVGVSAKRRPLENYFLKGRVFLFRRPARKAYFHKGTFFKRLFPIIGEFLFWRLS